MLASDVEAAEDGKSMDSESNPQVVRETLRRRLRTEYEKLKRRTATDTAPGRSDALNPDRADLARTYTLQEKDAALQIMERDRLGQIKRALERLEAGTYGQCVDCGGTISLERLQVLPSAEYCIACQEKQERN